MAIEPRGFTRNDENLLLIPLSGPIYIVSLCLNLPGSIYIYKGVYIYIHIYFCMWAGAKR